MPFLSMPFLPFLCGRGNRKSVHAIGAEDFVTEALRKPSFKTTARSSSDSAFRVDNGIWLVSFMQYDLGYIDLEEKTLQLPFTKRSTSPILLCLHFILDREGHLVNEQAGGQCLYFAGTISAGFIAHPR
jgi:hypothetical protein